MKTVEIIGISLVLICIILVSCSCKTNINKLPVVTGIITKIELIEIPNKAKGKPPRFETRITLSVNEVYQKGKNVDINSYDYPYFAGNADLINKFEINDTVKIICSSHTGRHIKKIEKLNK